MNSKNATSCKQTFYIIGTDEAGYGPNLGPLLVGASCWRMLVDVGETFESPRTAFENDLKRESQPVEFKPVKKARRRLKKRSAADDGASLFDFLATNDDVSTQGNVPQDVSRRSESTFDAAKITDSDADENVYAPVDAVHRLNESLSELSQRRGLFPLIDSKELYGPAKSLAALERSFWLAVLLANGRDVESRRDIFTNATFRTALELVARETRLSAQLPPPFPPPWEKDVDFPLPADIKTGGFKEIEEVITRVESNFKANAVRLIDVAARRVQPLEFNELLDSLELKSDLIAEITTSLAVETLARAAAFCDFENAPPIFVVLCDKLGGRDRYESLLSARFPDAKIKTIVEGRTASVYRLAARRGVVRNGKETSFPSELLIEIRFTAKGESNVPTALASIVAKYFRELSMKPFNDFWRRAANGFDLKPTAGYPLDAKRFRAEIDETRSRLAIDDATFWRKK